MQNLIIQNLVSDFKKGKPLNKSPLTAKLLELYDYFEYQKDSQNILQQLQEKVEYHYQPKNSFLFHKNQYSDYLFILLEGEILKLEEKDEYDIAKEFKLINNHRTISEQIKQLLQKQQDVTKLRKENSELKMEISELKSRNEEADKLIKEHCGQSFKNLYFNASIDEDINLFKITEKIMPGNLIGQISCIQSFDQRRAYSIFACEESRFLSIKLSHIQQILSEKIKVRSFIYDYFNCFEIDLTSLIDSKQFNLYFEEKTYHSNQTVIHQKEKDDHCFYLIREGKFQYSYTFNHDNSSEHQTLQNKNLLEMFQGDLFGHEQRSNSSSSRNPQKSKQFRPFNVVCNQDKSKVIKIQSLLLQFKISETTYAHIIDSGIDLYKRLMDEVGIIPQEQPQKNIPTNNFQQIKKIVKRIQEHKQINENDLSFPRKIQGSESYSPIKNMNSPRSRPLKNNKIIFRMPFKNQNSQSQRQSPIIIRESPKVEIKQRLVFNLSKESALNKFKHTINLDQAYNLKYLSKKIDSFPTTNTIDSESRITYSESNIDQKIFRTPQHLLNKNTQSVVSFNITNKFSTNSHDPSQSGFTEALSLYIKNHPKRGSIFSKIEKLERPKLSYSTQSTSSSQTNLAFNRSTSMIQLPSTSDLNKQEDKCITETDQFKDQQLFKSSQVAQHLIKKKINAFSYQKQNSLQIYQMQGKPDINNQTKQSPQDLSKGRRSIQNSLISLRNVENTERNKMLNAVTSMPDSPINKLFSQQSKHKKRPSLILDLKLIRAPIKSQELNQ